MENIIFHGETVSDFAIEKGFVDYHCIAKSFNLVLCNDVVKLFQTFDFERINENTYSDEEDILQWYIIDEWGADLLAQWLPDEIVYYSEELDLYVWGVCHYGTRWDYVLTDIAIIYNENGGFDFERG